MCCLFGLMDYSHTLTGWQKSNILSVLATQCEARGTDATGISYNSGGKLRIYKRPMAAHKLRFHIPDDASVIMGHTRMTTQGSQLRNYNNHPFPGRAGKSNFALAHNDVQLRQSLRLPKTRIQTDSYIAVQLIEHKKALDLNSLRYMAEQVEGSFSFTALDEGDNLYFVKGDNPLCLYHYPKSGLLLYASTEDILTKALTALRLSVEKPMKLDISCGDVLRIDCQGNMTAGVFDTEKLIQAWYASMYVPYRYKSYVRASAAGPEAQYIGELKSVAGAFGYSPEDVDALLEEGFSPEELENFFYCGEL